MYIYIYIYIYVYIYIQTTNREKKNNNKREKKKIYMYIYICIYIAKTNPLIYLNTFNIHNKYTYKYNIYIFYIYKDGYESPLSSLIQSNKSFTYKISSFCKKKSKSHF